MRILLVAPDSGLANVDAEIQAVVNTPGLNVTLLHGRVTEQNIIDHLNNQRCELLWLATHGNDQGVMLSDGLWDTSAMTAVIRSYAVNYVFLNTCASVYTANAIVQEGHADVICTISEIDDKVAYRTGVFFARQLPMAANVREAYMLSKPGNNQVYLYLSNGSELRQSIESSNMMAINDKLAHIEEQIVRLWSEYARVKNQISPQPQSIVFAIAGGIILWLLYTSWMIFEIRHFFVTNLPLGIVVSLLSVATAVLLFILARTLNGED